MNSAFNLNDAWFLLMHCEHSSLNFHELTFAQTEQELRQHMLNEFEGTNSDIVLKYSIEELTKGQSYPYSQHQGAHAPLVHVQVVHDSNLNVLYTFLDTAEVEDDYGDSVRLSKYMKKADSIDEVIEIVDIFNDSWDNYW